MYVIKLFSRKINFILSKEKAIRSMRVKCPCPSCLKYTYTSLFSDRLIFKRLSGSPINHVKYYIFSIIGRMISTLSTTINFPAMLYKRMLTKNRSFNQAVVFRPNQFLDLYEFTGEGVNIWQHCVDVYFITMAKL